MHNVKRSVERVQGVRKLEFDLNTGRGAVMFQPGKTVAPAELWKAIKQSGFTPVKIEYRGEVYVGTKSKKGLEKGRIQ